MTATHIAAVIHSDRSKAPGSLNDSFHVLPSRITTKYAAMLPELNPSDIPYRAFVKKIVANDEVWGLEGEEGLAISSSSENDEQDVIPFWSEESLAQSVAADDWAAFKPSSMTLAEFMENWLTGMHNDELLVGTDWDASLVGKEIEPLALALDLANEAIETSREMEFSNYKDLPDFRRQVMEASGLG